MAPPSSPDRNPFPRDDDVTHAQDVSTLNRDTLSAIKESDEMTAETLKEVGEMMATIIKAVFEGLSTTKSDDSDFDIVSRTSNNGNNGPEVKKGIYAHFVDTMTAFHARLSNKAVEANEQSDDGDFEVVNHTGNNVLKVKKDVDAHLIDTMTARHARLSNKAIEANAPLRSAAATAITATPFVLGGLAGLAI